MVKAGDKYIDIFEWGSVRQYHTVEQNGNKFKLFDMVKVTTKTGKTIEGEINSINEKSMFILTNPSLLKMSTKSIKYEDIENIDSAE